MKPITLLALTIGLSVSCSAQAQPASTTSAIAALGQYVTTVRFVGQTKAQSGILFSVTDSALVLAPRGGLKDKLTALVNQHSGTLPPVNSLTTALSLRKIPYGAISRVSLHRRGAAAKSMLIGIGLGAIVGAVQGDDTRGLLRFSAGDKAIFFGSIGALAGLVAGVASTNSVNAKRQSVATEMQGRLRKYAIVEQLKKADVGWP